MTVGSSGTSGREDWRRVLLGLGCAVTLFGLLHHVDHVVRGNHSGWPFVEEVTPFTFSLLVYALLLPGIFMNLWGRVAAGWWLFTAAVALALVTFVHFLGARSEKRRYGISTRSTGTRCGVFSRSSCCTGCW